MIQLVVTCDEHRGGRKDGLTHHLIDARTHVKRDRETEKRDTERDPVIFVCTVNNRSNVIVSNEIR